MSNKIIAIAKFDDVMKAELAAQRLADYDIKSILNGKNFAGMYTGLGVDLFNVTLQVLESDAAKAIEILDSVENNYSDEVDADIDSDGSDD